MDPVAGFIAIAVLVAVFMAGFGVGFKAGAGGPIMEPENLPENVVRAIAILPLKVRMSNVSGMTNVEKVHRLTGIPSQYLKSPKGSENDTVFWDANIEYQVDGDDVTYRQRGAL
jgi:hypothetical protein